MRRCLRLAAAAVGLVLLGASAVAVPSVALQPSGAEMIAQALAAEAEHGCRYIVLDHLYPDEASAASDMAELPPAVKANGDELVSQRTTAIAAGTYAVVVIERCG